MKESSGSLFLHQREPKFHASPEVENTVDYLRAGGNAIPNQPADKITAYLGFLADPNYVNNGILTGDQHSIDCQIEAASVALTPGNAHAYVKFQTKIARELGRGAEIDLVELDKESNMETLSLVRKDQQKQLGDWAEELTAKHNKYPNWFKHWMFENVKRHTAFNDELDKKDRPKGFERRSISSFALFPELDRESVALVYSALTEKLGGDPMGFEYDNMRALLDEANFGLLYGEAQNYGFKITDELKTVTTGSWHDFHQSDRKDESSALSDLIKSYRTGWCTAGSETAAMQLSAGDFYVWCSTNPETGKNEVPRIAVRMEDGQVAEVRGIVGGRRQELEPQLADVVMDKIKDMPGGESYFRKAEDMKRLTDIEKKVAADPEIVITSAELRFLYELDRDIQGFGYDRDPRIAEVRAMRAGRDRPELARIVPESIREQQQAAYEAYHTVASKLLGSKRGIFNRKEAAASAGEFKRFFDQKDREWRAKGVYDWLIDQLIESGSHFTLVATPKIKANQDQIIKLAEDFGKDQPYATQVYDEMYRRPNYSDSAWSGNADNDPFGLILIASRTDRVLSGNSVERQAALLKQMQRAKPRLGLRVPSLIDAICYWYTLRAQGDKLDTSEEVLKTYIRHFDLPLVQAPGMFDLSDSCPDSSIDNGGPSLGSSEAAYGGDARLGLG